MDFTRERRCEIASVSELRWPATPATPATGCHSTNIQARQAPVAAANSARRSFAGASLLQPGSGSAAIPRSSSSTF